MSSLRRYAPFALLVAAQIVLVVVAPSHGTTASGLGGTFSGDQSPIPAGSATPSAPSFGGGPSTSGGGGSTPSIGGGGGNTPVVTGGGGGGGNVSVGKRGTAPPASGSTTGKAFCVVGLAEHPPCIQQWAGGSNGGATWQGVTATTVTVVMYRPKANAAVDTILRETGTYISPQDEKQQFLIVTSWINKHYQLYGRKIKPVYVQGTCDIAPPNDTCFRGDADRIAAQYKPFALYWDGDTNEAAFFDELARKGIVSWGGWAFSDTFNNNLRPYHYDLFMGGDTQADFAGSWYCRRLAGGKAIHAGSASLRSKTRKVVVIYPDTEQTTPSAQRLIKIIQGCAGKAAVIDGKYSSNTATAAQQATTNAAKWKAAGVTTSLWFSDPIAPAYGTKAATAQSWYPENVLAGSGLLDYDALAQTYDQTQWKHAFGPSDVGATTPVMQEDAGIIWKAEGHSGKANPTAQLLTVYELSLTSGICAAGPKLTPLTYEYGLLTTPGYDQWSKWHDPQLVYLKFGRGDYTGVSDIREVYYLPNKKSGNNNKNGAYVALNGGRRYQLGGLPSGEFHLPSDA
ncbi:MAG: hypothetical protein QOJ03_464 [Frankiaceae bacterium]|nr:hypothetical protein [Frankiaceae bacterium]